MRVGIWAERHEGFVPPVELGDSVRGDFAAFKPLFEAHGNNKMDGSFIVLPQINDGIVVQVIIYPISTSACDRRRSERGNSQWSWDIKHR